MVGVAVVATIVDLSLRFSVKGLPVGLMGFSQVLGKSNFFFFFNVDMSLVPSCTKIFFFCIYWK